MWDIYWKTFNNCHNKSVCHNILYIYKFNPYKLRKYLRSLNNMGNIFKGYCTWRIKNTRFISCRQIVYLGLSYIMLFLLRHLFCFCTSSVSSCVTVYSIKEFINYHMSCNLCQNSGCTRSSRKLCQVNALVWKFCSVVPHPLHTISYSFPFKHFSTINLRLTDDKVLQYTTLLKHISFI